MNVLITGGSGLLGSMLTYYAPRKVTIYCGVHSNALVALKKNINYVFIDTTNKVSLDTIVRKNSINCIIHCAGINSPDVCDAHPFLANRINVQATNNIVRICKKNQIKLVFTSSNYVFDGKNPPYSESAQTCPINLYGKTKVESEQLILNSSVNAIIVRLMTMYGWTNPNGQGNLSSIVLNSLRRDKRVFVSDGNSNNYLWAGQAARYIWKLTLDNFPFNIIHLAGKESVSRYTFSIKLAEIFNLDTTLIQNVPESFFRNKVLRPLNTIFTISKLERVLSEKPMNISDGLVQMKEIESKLCWKNCS